MATIFNALLTAQSQGLDRLDAQLLLLHTLGKAGTERAWLIAHDAEEFPIALRKVYERCVLRRAQGEPLAYITGFKEFFGLPLQVDARVLIPRPDTETLVEWTLEILANAPMAAVLDLGTGSGAIALAIKSSRADFELSAIDFSQTALDVAKANAQRLKLDVRFEQGSWLQGIQGRFDAIVSNPPYIAEQDEHLAALSHEPIQALTSGKDGLDDLRQIIAQAPGHLKPGGWLALEHGYDQAEHVRALLGAAGLAQVQSRRDLNGIERCSAGCLSAA
jgi:release factor glutamine methyltransferase